MKAKIWCECLCVECGGMAVNSTYYDNPSTISELKNEVKDWIYDKDVGGNICPECQAKIKKKRMAGL